MKKCRKKIIMSSNNGVIFLENNEMSIINVGIIGIISTSIIMAHNGESIEEAENDINQPRKRRSYRKIMKSTSEKWEIFWRNEEKCLPVSAATSSAYKENVKIIGGHQWNVLIEEKWPGINRRPLTRKMSRKWLWPSARNVYIEENISASASMVHHHFVK